MDDQHYDKTKRSVLEHIQNLFEEMEEESVMSHQEKYTLLEDAFENASDSDELKVAFEQWYADHADDVEFEHDSDELWDQAVAGVQDGMDDDDDEDYDDEDEDDDE